MAGMGADGAHEARGLTAGAGRRRAPVTPPNFRDLFLGLGVTLLVAVPTLVVAEDWHGRPLIDQPGLGWVIPTVITALAFVAGGAVAGRRQPRLRAAVGCGFAMGLLTVLLLLAADVTRRALQNPTLPMGVVRYWIEAAVGSTMLALVGAIGAFRLLPGAGAAPVPAAEG